VSGATVTDEQVAAAALADADDIAAAVAALPAAARAHLAHGPVENPYCTVCAVICPNGNCVAYGDTGDRLEGFHHADLGDVAPLLDLTVAELRDAQRADQALAAQVAALKARIGTLRCQVIYRAAGWSDPTH
jgi:hypothetical protein